MSLLLLLASTANAFTLVTSIHDWQGTEDWCILVSTGDCDNTVTGQSNDTIGAATNIGAVATGGVFDTMTYEPSSNPFTAPGSDVVTLSHGGQQLPNPPSTEGYVYRYDHAEFDGNVNVDRDWYSFTTDAGICLQMCLESRSIEPALDPDDDWTLSLVDSDQSTEVAATNGISCMEWVSTGSGPYYLEVADDTPELVFSQEAFTYAHQYYRLTIEDIDSSGTTTWFLDGDGDGFGDPGTSVTTCVSPGPDYVLDNTDCDDTDYLSHPGAVEICDGADNDCANGPDDGLSFTDWFVDDDGDGFGDPDTASQSLCNNPGSGFVTNDDDCADDASDVFPGQTDDDCDGEDDDCDGVLDDDAAFTVYYVDDDLDGSGGTDSIDQFCSDPGAGWSLDGDDCDDDDIDVNSSASEVCDGVDNNCNGAIDDGLATSSYYLDLDGDGFGAGTAIAACADPGAGFSATDDDCDDGLAAVNPDATEVCDGLDNDCAGGIDDGFSTTTWYADADGDGFGDSATTLSACAQPSGYVADDTDCDDTEAASFPGNTEVCDGIDNDCANGVDDGLTLVDWYLDEDGDGHGTGTAVSACGPPDDDYVDLGDDCDDADDSVSPSANEVCDGADTDCDGTADDGLPTVTYYTDSDGDGLGSGAGTASCENPGAGFATNDLDCDDSDDTLGEATVGYVDNDGDGYGDAGTADAVCGALSTGEVAVAGDCDDNDSASNPGATEVCGNGIDEDCSGVADDGCELTIESEPYDGGPCGCSSTPGSAPVLLLLGLLGLIRRQR